MFFTTCGSRNPLTLGSLENPRTAKAHILLGYRIQTYYMSSGLDGRRPGNCEGLGSTNHRNGGLSFPPPRHAKLYTYTHHMHLRWFPRGTPSSFPESYLRSS
ncbi:hypothetical protein AB1N83_006684 [Pleurotus pulmonarius]